MKRKVAIIGAGISGLTAAYYLHQKGCELTIFDSSDRPGGVIDTIHKDGFQLERGPHTTLLKPEVEFLIKELSLEQNLCSPNENSRKRFILFRDNSGKESLKLFPTTPLSFLKTSLISVRAKMRTLLEPFIKKRAAEDESVKDFIVRRFGPEIAETFFSAFMAGIWAGNISQLSARSTLPLLWKLEKDYGSILRGFFKTKISIPRIVTFKNGLSVLPKALVNAIPQQFFLLNTKVIALKKNQKHLSLSFLDPQGSLKAEVFSDVIITSPSSAAHLLADVHSSLAKSIDDIHYSSVTLFHVSIPKNSISVPLEGFGFLIPEKWQNNFLGAIFNNTINENSSPKEKYLLTCFCKGERDENYFHHILAERLCKLIGCASEPTLLHTNYYRDGIRNYNVDHYHIQQSILAFNEKFPNIHFAGSWIDGTSIAHCIAKAKQLIEEKF